jgi:hypothetical protein
MPYTIERPYQEDPKSILRYGKDIEEIKKNLRDAMEAKIENIKDLHIQDITNTSLIDVLDALNARSKNKLTYEKSIEEIISLQIPYIADDKLRDLSPTERHIYHRNMKSLRQFSWVYSRSDVIFKHAYRGKPVSLEHSDLIIK